MQTAVPTARWKTQGLSLVLMPDGSVSFEQTPDPCATIECSEDDMQFAVVISQAVWDWRDSHGIYPIRAAVYLQVTITLKRPSTHKNGKQRSFVLNQEFDSAAELARWLESAQLATLVEQMIHAGELIRRRTAARLLLGASDQASKLNVFTGQIEVPEKVQLDAKIVTKEEVRRKTAPGPSV